MAGRARLASARRAAIDGVRRRAEYIYPKICHFRADFLCNCRRAARWDSTPYLLWFRLRRLGDRRALPPAVAEALQICFVWRLRTGDLCDRVLKTEWEWVVLRFQ